MDIFDNIVVFVGCGLIIIGLVLFIFSKKEDANNNHVEGFGIKLNVSNPAIILIVLGVGLILTPRLLPKAEPGKKSPEPVPTTTTEQTGVERSTETQSSLTQAQIASIEQAKNIPSSTVESGVQPFASAAYFPSGLWQLSSYQENGVDLSTNVGASIVFTKQSNTRYEWRSDFNFVDNWGNLIRYQYQGIISSNSRAYSISFVSSSDPNFVRQSAAPLELKLENGGQLHMQYFFNNSEILMHWQKSL